MARMASGMVSVEEALEVLEEREWWPVVGSESMSMGEAAGLAGEVSAMAMAWTPAAAVMGSLNVTFLARVMRSAVYDLSFLLSLELAICFGRAPPAAIISCCAF